MVRWMLQMILFLAAVVTSCSGAAKTPPLEYSREDVTIELKYHRGQIGPVHNIVVRGNGTGTYHMDSVSWPASDIDRSFEISDGQFVKILNMLYRADFFAWNDEYSGKPTASIQPDGVVEIGEMHISDDGWTSLSFRINDYEKHTTVSGGFEYRPLYEIAVYLGELADHEYQKVR